MHEDQIQFEGRVASSALGRPGGQALKQARGKRKQI